ncbi:MAG: hypothetical protein CFH37_00865 [Alphaproteobacteria bacterium MarineAlpha9_Bin7]|nr:MAG: hypothetical protein CFH37_00865 [Alphaproteobacteria bacterium MarineAlpha9_Bin7]
MVDVRTVAQVCRLVLCSPRAALAQLVEHRIRIEC